ncbi:MAG: asparagine synthase (glutamine-hydrolyzing) [Ilyomonas sp.]
MCRIAGIIDKRSFQIASDIILMRDAMKNGGPDSSGVFVDEEASLALGHRRLSIIDISEAGNQPMFNAAKDVVLVFNGEIYNYQDLKEELKAAGCYFSSNSDTEVILKGYEHWGTACFAKFKGMFAIALYDKKRKQLILARDHAGIKPLYYYADKTALYFASEIRAFNQLPNKWEENHLWKVYFLTYGYLPQTVTTLKGVKPLEKGSYLIFNTDTLESEQAFYYHDTFSEIITGEEEAKEQIRFALRTAIKRHLIADAPLGLFLSGGIDSSLLTLLAKEYKDELHTLSIIFDDEKYSEKYYQDIIVKKAGTKHDAFLLDKKHFQEAIPDILRAMDQPSADGINSYFISKFAKEAGLKAVLSGLGADELFGGYPSFRRNTLIKNIRQLPGFIINNAHLIPQHKYQKINFLGTESDTANYLFNRGYFTPAETARLFDMDVSEVQALLFGEEFFTSLEQLSEGNKTSYLEANLYMQNQLLKDTDYMSMWHSIEVRVPFLDYDFIKCAHKISSSLKFGNKQGKYLLIESFKDELPDEIWNRKKKGFQLPFDAWMQESLDQFISTEQDQEMHKKFKKGQLNWSRYWTYILSQSYQNSQSV